MKKKLYKSGRIWVAAIIAGSAMVLVNTSGSVVADSNTTEMNIAKSLPENGSFVSNDNGQNWKYVVNGSPISGLYKNDKGEYFYFSTVDSTQVKGKILSINNCYYYFDLSNGDAHPVPIQTGGKYEQISGTSNYQYKNQAGEVVTGLQDIDGQLRYFDETTGIQVKGQAAVIGGKSYYFDNNLGSLTSAIDQISLDNTNLSKGLVSDNGILKYYDPITGEQAKNKQIYTNGSTYFFDNSGVGQYLFTNTEEVSTDDSQGHNAANSSNTSDYTNTVDGFLTADTWYRPKDILDNGETWRPSNDGEYRPIITNWWPNKNVEVNYLNLMQKNNLLSNAIQYNLFTEQNILNAGAFQAQIAIEKRIKSERGTKWLSDLLFGGDGYNSFVKQQYIWNSDSEYQGQVDAWFQGGYLEYSNNPLTPNTNSNYRQSGNVFDFLLANDVDNSNPVVQAENLNWLYYLMNFGTITTNGEENNANFDSVRLDAVDFINNDAIQRTYDFLNQTYKLDENETNALKHISLVEASTEAGTTLYNQNALIESYFRDDALNSLANASGKNSSLENLIKYSYSNKVPNYSIIHAHDKGIQENVGAAISDATGANGNNFTNEQLKEGLDLYYQDQRSTNKKYNIYNLPSIYALMLTNQETVPRIYYGDMYQDDGQFMEKKSIYYDALNSLMLARKRYVAGGQSMSVDENGFLKSVRFGGGANTSQDIGTSETRTEGIGVIVGNNSSIQIADNAKVTLDMGAAHKNQAYRPVLLTTEDGIAEYDSDDNAPIVYTDENGVLSFTNKNINNQTNTKIVGALNPQVSGYLAVWVPVGASSNQDIHAESSMSQKLDNNILTSDDALNSNLIYEGFSNFQPMPTNYNDFTNVVIAKNAQQFSNWGVTSFEMAPQYRSSNDHTFLDSTIDNGYAFSDRYDLGFVTPTKYGTDEDLRNAIKALHQNGMQVMADVVMNQLYNLPGKEVVEANRASVTGNDAGLPFGKQLYVVNTVGGGQYQNKFGGEFLKEIKEKYPSLFDSETYQYYINNGTDVASSTRLAIPSNEKIKQWSAKYMNGTNVLGNGMGYVLKDWNTGKYFKLAGKETTLPKSLLYSVGWQKNDDGSWSYYSLDNGERLTGNQTIDNRQLIFTDKGVQVKGSWAENSDGTWSYYDNQLGDRLTGNQIIDGRQLMFTDKGIQIKGSWAENSDGTWSYYDNQLGDRLTGNQIIDGRHVLFTDKGVQVKSSWAKNSDGTWSYYDNVGNRVDSNQNSDQSSDHDSGKQPSQKVIGFQRLYDGRNVYYDQNGDMQYGQQNIDGKWYLFDKNTGAMQYGRQYIADQNKWVLYDRNDGTMQYGQQFDQNHWYLFDTMTGAMQYGRQYIADQNKWALYDRNDGTMQYGQQYDQGHWYLFDTITGAMQYGRQYIADQKKWVLYDRNDGTMQYGQQFDQGRWYLFDTITGAMQYGRQYIANQKKWVLYDRNDGTMQYGQQSDQGHWYLFDTITGAMQYGRQYIADQKKWVLYDRNDGTMQYGEKQDQGNWYLFDTVTGAMQYGEHYLDGSKKWANYNEMTGILY